MDGDLKNKKIETFSSDMAKALETPEQGLIRKIIAEQGAREEERKNLSPESKKNKKFIFFGILLLVISFILLFMVFFKKDSLNMFLAPSFTPIIFTDSTEFVSIDDLSKDAIAQDVFSMVENTKVKMFGIEALYLTENKKVVSLSSFMNAIQGNLSVSKNKAINDNFLMGVYKQNSQDFFILIQVNSFAETFETFREWEDKIFNDLHDFFGIGITPETGYLLTKDFTDGIIANKNARILYDNEGQIVTAFVFIDDVAVLITNSLEATEEVILRISGSKVKK